VDTQPPNEAAPAAIDQIVDSAQGPAFEQTGLPPTLIEALLRARRAHGGRRVIAEGHERDTLTYDRLITAAHALAVPLSRVGARGEAVGVMLPTSIGAIVAFFALHIAHRTPAMLNYSGGIKNVSAACALAGVKTVLTSSRFLRQGRLEALAEALAAERQVVHLEALVGSLSPLDKLGAFARARLPLPLPMRNSNDEAVILFTSGTTGAPKGVVLTHANLIANVEQCRLQTKFDPDWVFFNTLPVFHAFGLTGGALLPILTGLRVVLYPSPLHHERIPTLIESTGANVLLSTDTFASHYARAARPGALRGLKYVVLGAEQVRDETRQLYREVCNATILEGYGATECSPVVAVNPPTANRPGTVGRILPGVDVRLMRVEGLGEGGQLFVRGPNVMKGYLHQGAPGQIDHPPGGWFDTGDLATLDDDGYLTITGRLKRFVRIGAEMISLVAVEARAQVIWPHARHAAVAAKGDDRPEQIVLITEQQDATLAPLVEWSKAHGVRPLELPQRILVVEALPVLPTGKLDYPAARQLAEERLAARAQLKD
jgi:acyl-[acyl-carrier-protein]-phospholipid O-acyltransferase/long-chain-fatty-acid--[acyl-carrier-protein] ligase